MKISLVMPIRNGARFATEAFEGIRSQLRPADEFVIVADPTSSDNTLEILDELGPSVGGRVVLQVGSGVASAINEGIAATSGDAIAFVSGDDVMAPSALREHETALSEHPEAGYSVGLVDYFVDPETGPPPGWRPELLDAPRRARMIETTVVRRTLFERLGTHRDEMGAASDVDWFARANDAGIVWAVVPGVVVRKRVHRLSTAHTSPSGTFDLLAVARDAIRRKQCGQ